MLYSVEYRDHSEEGGRVVVCYTVWNTEITGGRKGSCMLYSVEYRDHSEEGGGAVRYCAVWGTQG